MRSGAWRPSAFSLAVDARALGRSGIGRYLDEVLRRLVRDPRFSRLTLAGHRPALEAWAAAHAAGADVHIADLPHGFYSPGAQGRWLALQARGVLRADAAFFPHYDVPLTDRSPCTVVTVQDVGHFALRETFPAWKRAAAGAILARAVRRASAVLVSSHATRRALLEMHPDLADRLSVIPLGVGDEWSAPPPHLSGERERFLDALRPFLLCVGNRKPHKNMETAVDVLARVRRDIPSLRLVVAGEDFGEDGEVMRRARAHGLSDAVIAVGRVDDGELRALYARAAALLFPSRYEGFGLPPLEAMEAGVPVVASDAASVPEVVGDAGFLHAPDDAEGMAADVLRLLTDEGLREEMVRRGRARAASFRWQATAERTADAIHAAAQAAAGARG